MGRIAVGLCVAAVLAVAFPFPFGGDGGDAPRPAGPLVRHDGRRMEPGWSGGRLVVAYLGFIGCTDYCPRGLDRMASVLQKLPPARRPVGAFATLEPERDTPERMADYLAAFGGGIVGITGDAADMGPITAALRSAAAGQDADPLSLLILAPDGRLMGVIGGTHSATEAAAAITSLEAAYRSGLGR